MCIWCCAGGMHRAVSSEILLGPYLLMYKKFSLLFPTVLTNLCLKTQDCWGGFLTVLSHPAYCWKQKLVCLFYRSLQIVQKSWVTWCLSGTESEFVWFSWEAGWVQLHCLWYNWDTLAVVGHCVVGIKVLKLVWFVPLCRSCVITLTNKIVLCLKI